MGKRDDELRAALEYGVYAINVESLDEIERAGAVARELGVEAPISVRVNPDVDAKTHPYIATGLRENKFGVPLDRALDAYQLAARTVGVRLRGVTCHIGSQLTELAPIRRAAEQVLGLVDQLAERGIELEFVDLGGGLGISYDQEDPPPPSEYGELMGELLAGRNLRLVIEPGRVIAGNAGVLLARVVRVKEGADRRFVVLDAAMNDLLRPALYDSYHEIEAVERRGVDALVDVVGPVCESADVFARRRPLPDLERGDLVVIRSAGAYSFSMASNYNSRPRPPEVLVDRARYSVIRTREQVDDLVRGESIPDWLRGPPALNTKTSS